MNDNEIIQQFKKYEPIFGNWYIKRFVGEGGFAKVFEIIRNDFGREYVSALKIITVTKTKSEINTLKSEGMTDEDIRGYLRGIVEDTVGEIQLMYKMRGRGNIVGYEDHEVVEHEDGMGWDILIKMEYLTSLSTYIRQQNGRLAKRDIIKLGMDICKALESCQRYNIIHRDIKADNIFISDDGEFKLGDFGIARVIERKDQTLSKKGTSAYMAPEVYKGQTYTSAVDIYSLGMVMYRLMNNNRGPFLPPYPQQMSLDDRDHAMMLRMSGERFPKPSQVTRGRLIEIVLKACAYRPEERYSSPGFMRQELEAILLDLDEMTTEEWVTIYDEQARSATLSSTASFSHSGIGQSGISESKKAELAETTEVLREEGETEILRGDATEVLREESASEVLREADARKMLSGETKVCTKCGGIIEYDAIFCSLCGANQKEKSKKYFVIGSICTAVILLAVIIGVAVTHSGSSDNYVVEGTDESAQESQENTVATETTQEPELSWADNIMMPAGNYVYAVLGSDIEKTDIKTITFLDSLNDMPDDAWDVSVDGNRRVMAWVQTREDNYYDLFIGGEGGVAAHRDSQNLFSSYSNVEQIQMNGNFYTENATNMSYMFSFCESLKDLDASGFDTSKVTDMNNMFCGCSSLTSLNISGFDTMKVTNMREMFEYCTYLKSVDVSSFDTSNVTDMHGMFSSCNYLVNLDVSGFDTSKVTDMGFMFNECNILQNLDVSGFDTSNVTNMNGMFRECNNLANIDVSGFDTSKVTDMGFMFDGCNLLRNVVVSNFDTSKVTDMSSMFSGCESLTGIDTTVFDTSEVTDMGFMFNNCSHLVALDVVGFDTSRVTDMSYMFAGCSSLTFLDVSSFDTSKVTSVKGMFRHCDVMTSLYISPSMNRDMMADVGIPEGVTIYE